MPPPTQKPCTAAITGHRAVVDRGERGEAALVGADQGVEALGVLHLLDVDAGVEAPALGAQDDDADGAGRRPARSSVSASSNQPATVSALTGGRRRRPRRCPRSSTCAVIPTRRQRSVLSRMTIEAVLWDYGGVFTRVAVRVGDRVRATRSAPIRPSSWRWCSGRTTPTATIRGTASSGARCSFVDALAEIGGGGRGRRLPIRGLGEMFGGDALRRPIDRSIVVDSVRAVRARGLRTGIITNNIREYGDAWRGQLPIDELFDTVVDSSHEGVRKPNPVIYHTALERLGVANPSHAVFLDDFEGERGCRPQPRSARHRRRRRTRARASTSSTRSSTASSAERVNVPTRLAFASASASRLTPSRVLRGDDRRDVGGLPSLDELAPAQVVDRAVELDEQIEAERDPAGERVGITGDERERGFGHRVERLEVDLREPLVADERGGGRGALRRQARSPGSPGGASPPPGSPSSDRAWPWWSRTRSRHAPARCAGTADRAVSPPTVS